MSGPLTVNLYLTPEQALALAQFCKRIAYADVNSCAVDSDEAVVMIRALDLLQRELAALGYAPR